MARKRGPARTRSSRKQPREKKAVKDNSDSSDDNLSQSSGSESQDNEGDISDNMSEDEQHSAIHQRLSQSETPLYQQPFDYNTSLDVQASSTSSESKDEDPPPKKGKISSTRKKPSPRMRPIKKASGSADLSPTPTTKAKAPQKATATVKYSSDTFKYENGIADKNEPINNVAEILVNMTKKVMQKGLKRCIDRFVGGRLRYSSMCSGADTGKIAINLILDYLKSCGEEFVIEHCFAAEIEDWKQAFLRRNHDVPIIFNDITEMLVALRDRSKPLEATTAYGGKAVVPDRIDLLHAGFCCVDFSGLNSHRKTLDQQGESGSTFMAIRAYASVERPKMIIFENVKNAPWDDIEEMMYQIGYACRWVNADSKDFFLPQTRNRGYALCIDERIFPRQSMLEHMLDMWEMMFRDLGGRATVPYQHFLLPSDDPRLDVTLVDEVEDLKNAPWVRCKIRHAETRTALGLGEERPITDWNEDGSSRNPEYFKQVKGLTQRVSDTVDMAHLRNLLRGFDDRYYDRNIELSQNIDRYKDTNKDGIAPCVTPTNMQFTTYGGRRILGREALQLQGFPTDQLDLSQLTQGQQIDLAGNAMSSTVIGAATLAALAIFPDAFEGGCEEAKIHSPDVDLRLDGESELVPKELDPTSYEVRTVDEAKSLARQTRRLCYCEGRHNCLPKDFQECQACNHTTCTTCGRKPIHEYILIAKSVIDERKRPWDFEQFLKKVIPMKISLTQPSANFKEFVDSIFEIHHQSIDHGIWNLIKPAIESALSSEVYFRHIRRADDWQVVYDSSEAKILLVISEMKVEWLVYVNVDREPLSSRHRRYLEQFPIARMQAQNSLTQGIWSFWLPKERGIAAIIKGKGQLVKSYEAICGLPAYSDSCMWSEYSVEIAEKDRGFFESQVHGDYQLFSECGQAFNSLYVQKDSWGSNTPLFFYFEHQRMSGNPKDHFFIFTHDKRRLEFGESRRTIARLLPSWRRLKVQAVQTAKPLEASAEESDELVDGSKIPSENHVDIYVDGRWTKLPQLSFNFRDKTPVTVYQMPEKLTSPLENSCKSQRAALIVKVNRPGEISSSWIRNQWTLVTRENEIKFITTFRWMFEHGLVMDGHSQMTDRRDGIEHWQGVLACSNDHPCVTCAPAPPKILWSFDEKQGKQRPFEDPLEATIYEKAMKSRPEPTSLMYLTDGRDNFEIKIGINPQTLICRAKAQLSCRDGGSEITTSWRLITDDDSARRPELRPLTLTTHSATEVVLEEEWASVPLFSELKEHQKRPFIWMHNQERYPKSFIEEEVAEARISGIGYRVEGKAMRTIPLRGGAAHYPVGSGKTVLTLALIDSRRSEDELHAKQPHIGRINLKATFIFVPSALSLQWRDEIARFLPGHEEKVLVIRDFKKLQTLTIGDFMNAEIIIMNVEVLKSPQYSLLVAQFAGIVEGAENDSPRAKTAWYKRAMEKFPSNVDLLLANPGEFQDHVKEQFEKDFNESQSTTAPVPSKRTTGASFKTWEQRQAKVTTTKKKKKGGEPNDLQPREDVFFRGKLAEDQSFESMRSPPIEIFGVPRLVVDEYHYVVKGIVFMIISRLTAFARWILSGTPPNSGFVDISNAAKLLGASLGIDNFGAMTADEFKKATVDMTSPEKFLAYGESCSSAYIERRHVRCQNFLDNFSRTCEPVNERIDCSMLIRLAELPPVEYAINLELMHRFAASNFERPKGRCQGNDTEERIHAVCNNWSSGQEALILRAGHFNDEKMKNIQVNGAAVVEKRQKEYDNQKLVLRPLLRKAQQLQDNVRGDYNNFTEWKTRVVLNRYGDLDATTAIQNLINKAMETSSTAEPNPENEGIELRIAVGQLNKETEELVNLQRSLRFVKTFCMVHSSVKESGKHRNVDHGFTCSACNTEDLEPGAVTLLSKCGHLVCNPNCVSLIKDICPVACCHATTIAHQMIPGLEFATGGSLEDDSEYSKFGKKLQKMMELIEKIPKGEKILLFAQSQAMFRIIKKILGLGGVSVSQLTGGSRDPVTLEEFQKKNGTKVLILNIGDSSAAGSNLTCANHVIFVAPYYTTGTDAQYTYEAARTQAIGRARRYGQTNTVMVYDFLASKTIDVDIFEQRSLKIVKLAENPRGELVHQLIDPEPGEVSEYKSCISEYFLRACDASS